MISKHWKEVRLNLRNIKLDPLMYVGMSFAIKVPNYAGRGQLQWQLTAVKFDKEFLAYCLGEMIKKLIPLHPDKIEEILNEALEYYRAEWNIYQAESGGDREPDNETYFGEINDD
ncbi:MULTISPECIES: hypothetical protein [Limnospira]|uniref:hypothetical protein n=1 Tax=Limnospira TaxID=2596745 RepID=UPI00185FCD1F|nr:MULTISPECIES: hypothetical protein [Limnospira]MDT9190318.1 hypothetical protein [Limnospira sp. PMC 894.15]MDT9200591.1 hypothetical protein [Limnospira sp. PMC 1042.18]QNH57997.1 MAG: hypothetical protein H2674_00870 [Limnospira indica BM01]